MKVSHWTLKNGSGMANVACDLARAESAAGLTSIAVACDRPEEWEVGMDADIHVVHTHLPDPARIKGKPIVYIPHGTPEHCFTSAVEAGLNGGYGASDPWMLAQYWLQRSDAVVTFWERHAAIWNTMLGGKRSCDVLPLGIDTAFWTPVASAGKFAGDPSLFTAENCHYIKWPLDLAMLWPWMADEVPGAALHLVYLPRDQHRWWFPLLNANGASFKMYISPGVMDKPALRNAFCSTDYYIGLVRYGDHNRICLEAKASGATVISFAGNQYADYWLPEGDQRTMFASLTKILKGEAERREPLAVPSLSDTATRMREIYERISS